MKNEATARQTVCSGCGKLAVTHRHKHSEEGITRVHNRCEACMPPAPCVQCVWRRRANMTLIDEHMAVAHGDGSECPDGCDAPALWCGDCGERDPWGQGLCQRCGQERLSTRGGRPIF